MPDSAADDPRIRGLASKLFWWKRPDEALADQRRFLAQAMTYGTWEDMVLVRSMWGADAMRRVLADAPPGVFGRRSWSYWACDLRDRPGPTASETAAVTSARDREDGDLPTLPEPTRRRLVAAAASVDRLPIVGAYAPTVLPTGQTEGGAS